MKIYKKTIIAILSIFILVSCKPTEVKPTEVKPTEVKPTEVKPTEVKPTEVKPTEVKDPGANWSKYFEIKIIDNTLVSKDSIEPFIKIIITKKGIYNLSSFKFIFYYEYGYKYFSKDEIESFEFDSEKISKLNNGESIELRYNYELCPKIKIEGFKDYDIYDPPNLSKSSGSPMILYGLKLGGRINEIYILR